MNKNVPSSELIIKPASFNDIPHIQEIAGKTWPVAYEPIIGKDQVEYMLGLFYSRPSLEDQMKNQHYFFLALLNYSPIGFVSFSHLDGEIYKLHKLYVLPHAQKSGAGRRLLETAETVAKSMGGEKLRLNVNRQNEARAFYERAGFTITGQEDIDIGNGYLMNDYVLEKELE